VTVPIIGGREKDIGRMVFTSLAELYTSYGLQLRTSISLYISRSISEGSQTDPSMTYLIHNDRLVSPWGGGIHVSEVYLIESLGRAWSPSSIFVVGNSFGWSTLALALSFPSAKVVAIDSCAYPFVRDGLDLTNKIAQDRGLNVRAVEGTSPEDTGRIIRDELGGAVDLAFIDGDHTNEQQTADFEAIRPHFRADCVCLFHDVVSFRMTPSLNGILARHSALDGRILSRTFSGMGAVFSRTIPNDVRKVLWSFTDPFVERADDGKDGFAYSVRYV
jgi:predicted O-methyltransferase YrrM